jgi:hypothetical protein
VHASDIGIYRIFVAASYDVGIQSRPASHVRAYHLCLAVARNYPSALERVRTCEDPREIGQEDGIVAPQLDVVGIGLDQCLRCLQSLAVGADRCPDVVTGQQLV